MNEALFYLLIVCVFASCDVATTYIQHAYKDCAAQETRNDEP